VLERVRTVDYVEANEREERWMQLCRVNKEQEETNSMRIISVTLTSSSLLQPHSSD
jgi:hypothetical protein